MLAAKNVAAQRIYARDHFLFEKMRGVVRMKFQSFLVEM